MKKALQLASVASMIDQFTIPNIELMQSLGYQVDVAADFSNPGNISLERSKQLISRLENMGVRVFDVAIPRSLSISHICGAYKNVREIIHSNQYELIHCHSPIGGAIARLAAKPERNAGTKVLYTAHGFHFFDGAPLKNWIVFYPIEKWLSKYTDTLITINKEDYQRASKHFKTKQTVYVPGIGIDINKFRKESTKSIREEFGIDQNACLLLSVGELNQNKNHEVVIKALAKMPDQPYYLIVGKGEKQQELEKLIENENLSSRVKLVGFREDVSDFYGSADAFVFPSFREGLSVSLMEAMASGLPIACSRIRGNVDLIDENGGVFFDPNDVDDVKKSIEFIMHSDCNKMGNYNREKVVQFGKEKVYEEMKKLYRQCGDERTKSVCIIRAKLKKDYVYDAIKNYGYAIFTPYKGNRLFLRIFREIWFRCNLPGKRTWYRFDKKCKNCDDIIIFDPLITPDYIEWVHKKCPNTRVVLSYENRTDNTINPDMVPPYVNKCSYDTDDCSKYGMKWCAPAFFLEYRRTPKLNPTYDVLYVGRDKGRAETLFKIKSDLEKMGLNTYFHICADRSFMRFKKKYYEKVLDYDEYLELLVNAKAILNIVPDNQTSVTQRELEAIFDGIKCITNNRGVKSFELYDDSIFFILGENEITDLPTFLRTKIRRFSDDELEKYDFNHRIVRMIEDKD